MAKSQIEMYEVKPTGKNGAHILVSKEMLGKKAIVIFIDEDSEPIEFISKTRWMPQSYSMRGW